MSCNCQICRNTPAPFIMLCRHCGNFHSWRPLPDGCAVCLGCGCVQGYGGRSAYPLNEQAAKEAPAPEELPMTRRTLAECLKLPAGPELDAEVAERCMGWRWIAFDGMLLVGTQFYPQKTRVRIVVSPECKVRWPGLSTASMSELLADDFYSQGMRGRIPQYSRSFDDAYLVLAKLKKQRKSLPVIEFKLGAPLKVCRAALRATGE